MRRSFGIVIVRFAFVMPATLPVQEHITVLYPSPAGSWMIPVNPATILPTARLEARANNFDCDFW